MQKIVKKVIGLVIMALLFLQQGCDVYTFSGASIPDNMKTISVQFFENNAPLVVPYLSQQFTEALKDRIRNQSRLSIIRADADASFEGRITGYSIVPVAIQGNERAGLNRLTITVSVKYKNTLKPELSFEQSFSEKDDFPSSGTSLQAQEPKSIATINQKLTEAIFNRAFANW